ncbi:MAG: clostripain-related cysteine peptidase [Chloroflexota bacterium]|nr:clostripain-related cysteine peptidase [Chloroflexota bacterium]
MDKWRFKLWPELVWATTSPLNSTGASSREDRWNTLFTSSGSSNDDPNRTVRARRRRRTDSSGERERAEAPQREEPSSSSSGGYSSPPPPPPPPSGGGYSAPPPPPPSSGGYQLPSSSGLGGGSTPGTGGPKGIGLIVILGGLAVLLFLVAAPFLLGGGIGGSNQSASVLPSQPAQPAGSTELQPMDAGDLFGLSLPGGESAFDVQSAEPNLVPGLSAPAPASMAGLVAPPVPPGAETWTVMLYQDADDKILEQDIFIDMNEAELVGSGNRVNIVSQIDRYKGGYQGDGNWTNTRRYFLTPDSDLNRLHSPMVEDLGEVNMSDADTLADFVIWAAENFPADKYALIMSDHGMGWPGGWSDPDPRTRTKQRAPIAKLVGDQIYLDQLDETLTRIRAQTDIDKLEFIGLDACLMGHLEVLSALAPHARYAVVSQETEPAVGWAYASFLGDLRNNPDMDGADLGKSIVNSYIDEDQRIVDNQARSAMVGRGSFAVPTARQLAGQMEHGATLAAADLTAVPALMDSVNDLAFQLQSIDQRDVAQARNYAQSFTSIFGQRVPPSYLDLGNLVGLLARTRSGEKVNQPVNKLLQALDKVVIAERHGDGKPGSTGVSIYFPDSDLYRQPASGPDSYVKVTERFSGDSLWDDYLRFHYTGQTFDAAAQTLAVPNQNAEVVAPGKGNIQVSPIRKSSNVAAPGKPVLFSIDIDGENLGYISFFTGFFDQEANSVFVADQDYLESAKTREIGGVYYPDWGEGSFTLEFEWEPLMFAIDDGVETVVAGFTPETYGATPENAVYTVDGIFTYGDDIEQRRARLYFRDGSLRQVFGFSGEANSIGSPREIIPRSGDSITLLERWMDLDQNGRATGLASQEGGTLTFGDQPFVWKELDAAAGEYVVGFIVEDLDGNSYPTYTQIEVR